ncbi:RecQ family ATP-dependent DNA helicase [Peribacillus deserti]|uniref:ATP-dependent DNA helicase RecQ n=1 Tax=Peribacillus deserti TaxID=673318 RepID=A0A2N5M1R5_9BACI|nr:RecQ family ATP-dependent DNA helicase [Peribacillus deserti]PLT28300.1 ATP-dependent DNA helicase [Peribacillus deserti]
MNLEGYLEKYFGYTNFRPGQKETIMQIMDGKHTLSMLPTGTGKSLCYQLPVYIMNKPAVVVSPLLSLMQDQAEQIRVRGEKRVVSFNSFLSFEEKRYALNHLHTYRFIFVSPEMLNSKQLLEGLKKLDIGLFVVDEAHCISQWGYDFRPDYLNLGPVRKELGYPLTLALTATATPAVRSDIIRELGEDGFTEILSSVDRSNIALRVEKCSSYEEKQERLLTLVKDLQGPGIVYFSSKKTAETAASLLQRNGTGRTAFYHGGLEQEQRILIQQQFIKGELDLICATSAFGMGINKENVRYVIHFQMPMQMESYVQEIGRAGRDGKDSAAILLYLEGDEGLQLNFIENELPSGNQIRGIMSYLRSKNPSSSEELSQIMLHEDLAGFFSLNEIQLRITQHLLQSVNDMDDFNTVQADMIGFVEKRKEAKIQKLRSLLNWVHTDTCRRTLITRYFQQDILQKPEQCCDNCGMNIGAYYQTDMPDNVDESRLVFDWKEELIDMLIPGRNE